MDRHYHIWTYMLFYLANQHGRMLWCKTDIPEDERGPRVPALAVRRSGVVALSFIVREKAVAKGTLTPL